MTPEEARERLAGKLYLQLLSTNECEHAVDTILAEREALLVALGGRQLPPRGTLLTTPPDGDSRFVTGWVVPDE